MFSDPQGAKLSFLREASSQGYAVLLVFIGLENAELAIARVMQRVDAGGHDVPDEKITTRFPRSLKNLRDAIAFVDYAVLFDNSSADEPYRLVAEFADGTIVRRGMVRPRWAAALIGSSRS